MCCKVVLKFRIKKHYTNTYGNGPQFKFSLKNGTNIQHRNKYIFKGNSVRYIQYSDGLLNDKVMNTNNTTPFSLYCLLLSHHLCLVQHLFAMYHHRPYSTHFTKESVCHLYFFVSFTIMHCILKYFNCQLTSF